MWCCTFVMGRLCQAIYFELAACAHRPTRNSLQNLKPGDITHCLDTSTTGHYRKHDQSQQCSPCQQAKEPEGSLLSTFERAQNNHERTSVQGFVLPKSCNALQQRLTGYRTERKAQRTAQPRKYSRHILTSIVGSRNPNPQGRRGHHQAWQQQGP